MTVSNSGNKEVYTGNGGTADFSFPHYFFANGDLQVYETALDGTITLLTLTTDYTITGAGNPAGGTVHMIVIPATGVKITIVRVVALTQTSDFVPNDSLPAEVLEQGLDRAIMGIQQVSEKIDRSILLPISSTLSGLSLPEPDAGKGLKWNAGEDGLENTTANADDALAQAQAEADDAAVSAAAALASQGAAATSATNSSNSATASANSATLSQDWANKTTGVVASSEYSSKAYAIGGTGVTNTAGAGAAKEWATKTSGTVDTTEFSAKEYAFGTQASTGGSSKSWANTAHNTVVPGSGGTFYSALHWATEAALIVGAADGVVKISGADTIARVVSDKLVGGSNITLTIENAGGDENLRIDGTNIGMEQIAKVTVSGSLNYAEFTFPAGYDGFEIEYFNVRHSQSGNASPLVMQFFIGSYVTSGYAWANKRLPTAASPTDVNTGSTSDSYIQLNGSSNSNACLMSGVVKLGNPTQASRVKSIYYEGVTSNPSDAGRQLNIGTGGLQNTTAATKVRIFQSNETGTDNFLSDGVFVLKGNKT